MTEDVNGYKKSIDSITNSIAFVKLCADIQRIDLDLVGSTAALVLAGHDDMEKLLAHFLETVKKLKEVQDFLRERTEG